MFQFSSGTVLGRYELLIPVAQGGMADVWAARLNGSRGFTKLVAIKTIRSGALDDARLEQMLLAEAQLAAQIQHPNVISTLELGEQEDSLFLVMEWADAEPLSVLLKGSREDDVVPAPIAANIIAQACRGAHCAHELRDAEGNPLGVVHRDLSPQNLLLTYAGIVKVVDFGVAKATQRTSALTEDGELKGKLAYMSPEQVRGEAIDRRTDVFALGTILYLLTTGQHPFKCSHPAETLNRLASDAPFLPPNRKQPDYPPALQAVVLRALHKDREQRYPTAEALLLALEEAVPESKGIEAEVAKFLFERCPGLGERRRQHIRTAGELLDRSAGPPQSLSPSSISAVSVATQTGTTNPSQIATPPTSELSNGETPAVDFRPPSQRRWLLASAGLAFAGIGALLLTRWPAPSSAPPLDASNPKASLTWAAAAAPPVAEPHSPLPNAAASAPQAAVSSGLTTGSERANSEPPRSRRGSAQRAATGADVPVIAAPGAQAPLPRTPSSAQAAPASAEAPVSPSDANDANRKTESASNAEPGAASETSRAAPRTKRPPSKPKKKDSWDPATFGGRL
jgi:serine/threonine-protein kinase